MPDKFIHFSTRKEQSVSVLALGLGSVSIPFSPLHSLDIQMSGRNCVQIMMLLTKQHKTMKTWPTSFAHNARWNRGVKKNLLQHFSQEPNLWSHVSLFFSLPSKMAKVVFSCNICYWMANFKYGVILIFLGLYSSLVFAIRFVPFHVNIFASVFCDYWVWTTSVTGVASKTQTEHALFSLCL